MKILLKCLIVALFCMSASTVFAQQNIAVIYMQTAMINTDYAKEKIKALEASESFQSRVKKLRALTEELQAMQKDRETNGLTWSQEQAAAFEQRGREKVEERNLIRNQLDGQRQVLLRDIETALTPKIEEIVPAMIEEKKIDLLLNNQAVLMVADKHNLTQELIDRLNKSVK